MYADNAFITNCDRTSVSTIQAEEVHTLIPSMHAVRKHVHPGESSRSTIVRKGLKEAEEVLLRVRLDGYTRHTCFTTKYRSLKAFSESPERAETQRRTQSHSLTEKGNFVSHARNALLVQPFTAHIDPDRTERKYARDSKGDHPKFPTKATKGFCTAN